MLQLAPHCYEAKSENSQFAKTGKESDLSIFISLLTVSSTAICCGASDKLK
jgi:hypothetical protein